MWDPHPYVFLQTLKPSNFKFGPQLGFETSLPKKPRFGPKLAGVWVKGASKKIWDPLRISATAEASNFKFGTQIRFGTRPIAYQKTAFRTKIGGVLARGASQKNWDPLLFSATIEASNFKFGTQLAFGTSLPKKQRFGPKLAGVWAKGASKKSWDPLPIFATVEASD